MPITIDDTLVGAVNIDGTEVGEITMDGEIVWSAGLKILAGAFDGHLDLVYPINSQAWRYTSSNAFYGTAINPEIEKIYTAEQGGIVRKLDMSGNQEWSLNLTGNARGVATYGSGGYVYASAFDFDSTNTSLGLYKFDASNNQLWHYNKGSKPSVKAVACDNNGNVYITKQQTDGVFKLDSSGNKQWGNALGEVLYSIVVDGSYVWVGGHETLFKLNESDGNIANSWSMLDGNDIDWIFDLTIDKNGYIYIVDNSTNDLFKLDASGNVQWQNDSLEAPHSVSITPNNELYVGSDPTTTLYCLDYMDGSIIWEYTNLSNAIGTISTEPGTKAAFPTHW